MVVSATRGPPADGAIRITADFHQLDVIGLISRLSPSDVARTMLIRKPPTIDYRLTPPSRRKHIAIVVAVASLLVECAALWRRGRVMPGNVVVRCRKGHLFTTIWVPGASAKSIRLGWWRVQCCPVGGHWALVAPVAESELSERERRAAREHRDVRVP